MTALALVVVAPLLVGAVVLIRLGIRRALEMLEDVADPRLTDR